MTALSARSLRLTRPRWIPLGSTFVAATVHVPIVLMPTILVGGQTSLPWIRQRSHEFQGGGEALLRAYVKGRDPPSSGGPVLNAPQPTRTTLWMAPAA
jgi:hypothetical protein